MSIFNKMSYIFVCYPSSVFHSLFFSRSIYIIVTDFDFWRLSFSFLDCCLLFYNKRLTNVVEKQKKDIYSIYVHYNIFNIFFFIYSITKCKCDNNFTLLINMRPFWNFPLKYLLILYQTVVCKMVLSITI